jgi:ubiquitin-protein ligase
MIRTKRIRHESLAHGWTPDVKYTELVVNSSILFSIPENYPFQPPQLYIQTIPYTEVMKTKYTTLLNLIRTKKYPMTYCRPLIEDWSPCYTCAQVYTQYTDFMNKLNYIEILEHFPFDDLIMKNISTFLF